MRCRIAAQDDQSPGGSVARFILSGTADVAADASPSEPERGILIREVNGNAAQGLVVGAGSGRRGTVGGIGARNQTHRRLPNSSARAPVAGVSTATCEISEWWPESEGVGATTSCIAPAFPRSRRWVSQ